MSYKNAKACFDQNIQSSAAGKNKESTDCWNLNRGLLDLTKALEKDFEALNERMKEMEKLLEMKANAATK